MKLCACIQSASALDSVKIERAFECYVPFGRTGYCASAASTLQDSTSKALPLEIDIDNSNNNNGNYKPGNCSCYFDFAANTSSSAQINQIVFKRFLLY